MKRAFADWLIPRVTSVLIRFLYWSMRIRWVGAEKLERLEENGGRLILAFWHGQILLMIRCGFSLPITAMISQHRDGQLIADTMGRLGAKAARGSTTRGGSAALRKMMRAAAEGSNLAITPDGPRGPRHVAQPGAVILAKATGLPILPATFSSKKKSSCARGISSNCPCRSLVASSSSESPSKFRVMLMNDRSMKSGIVWRAA